MKNNSGFSLVELIVVIAIMAILAGVAVPTYSKYVSKANDAAVVAQLDEVKTAALAAAAAEAATVTSIVVKDNTDIVVNVTKADNSTGTVSVADYLGYTKIDFPAKTTYDGKQTTWTSGSWGTPVDSQ